MKRIGWTAMLLSVALMMAGCSKSDPDTDSKDGEAKPGAATLSPDPTDEVKVPENVDAEKVTGAVGNALLKSVGFDPPKGNKGDGPPFDP